MNCNKNCQLCPKLLVSTSVVAAGGQLQITIPTTIFNNQQKACLVIAQTIPAGTTSDQVVIVDGASIIPLVDKCFNFVRADQVRSRKIYKLCIGTTPAHATVTSCNLCPTAFVAPQITGVAPSTPIHPEDDK
ncbi:MAG: hypothetical protein RR420_05455 [Anaerovoracaceae bacterium]